MQIRLIKNAQKITSSTSTYSQWSSLSTCGILCRLFDNFLRKLKFCVKGSHKIPQNGAIALIDPSIHWHNNYYNHSILELLTKYAQNLGTKHFRTSLPLVRFSSCKKHKIQHDESNQMRLFPSANTDLKFWPDPLMLPNCPI